MEAVLTDWADISELLFDATRQSLTIVYRRGETRTLAPVSQSGFDRFLGRPRASAKSPATRG